MYTKNWIKRSANGGNSVDKKREGVEENYEQIVESIIKKYSYISSDAPLWFKIFGEDHITLIVLFTCIVSLFPIGKLPKLIFLIIIGICLVLNGAIHLAVIDYKEK